jgi:hypothetical protein
MANKKKFIPLTSLDNLSDVQKTEYKVNACEYFEIPPELSLLEFMWLDSGDAGRHLVLYAKKGATDIMRGNRGISVDEIREVVGDGSIMFIAKGHDKTGRTDVAVGAADTRGRSGKYLSDAIMTAQTRATRRLTLQFVGGGLLDESEVQNTTTDISRATQPLAEIAAPPSLSPNPSAGRDVTPMKVGDTVQTPNGQVLPVVEAGTSSIDPKIIAAGDSLVKNIIEATNATIAAAIAEEPKKRRRRKKSEVVLESPDQPTPVLVKQCLACRVEVHDKDGIYVNADDTPHVCLNAAPTPAQQAAAAAMAGVNATKLTEAAAVVPEAPLPPRVELKDQPNAEQIKVFKDRLFNYTNTILKQGKMIPCEGIGGIAQKMSFFVKAMFATAETKHLTVNQWESFLGFLDEKYAEIGAEGLVTMINQKIGAKE